MKYRYEAMIIMLFLLGLLQEALCQPGSLHPVTMEPYKLAITVHKTTNLIFPSGIKSVDRGSADVLAQKAGGTDNILLVKAGKENFIQTNLSVITEDGKLYSFIVDYAINPGSINFFFYRDSSHADYSAGLTPRNEQEKIKAIAENILRLKSNTHGVSAYSDDFKFRLKGIYINGETIFLKLELMNNSSISYDIGMLKFFILDERKLNRTASQEIEMLPLYLHGDTSTVKSDNRRILVFALPKFTIPDRKYLSVQLMENNGGRNFQLRIRNRKLIKAPLVEER